MIPITTAKALARELAGCEQVTHSRTLEAVAHACGYRDWNSYVAAAPPDAPEPRASGDRRPRVIPILRMFDVAVARSFYVDYLGFAWRWEHQSADDYPVYAEVERDGSVLHLSEHHGDATPGSAVLVVVDHLDSVQEELLTQRHRHSRPGIEMQEWGRTMTIEDPFGNRLRFWERPDQA